MPDKPQELGRKIGAYIAIALAGIMVFFLVICLEGYESGRSLYTFTQSQAGRTTSGIVTGLNGESAGSGGLKATYRYTRDTGESSGSASISKAAYDKLRVGGPISITYSSKNPTRSELTGSAVANTYVQYLYALCWFEGACLVVLAYIWYSRVRENRRQREHTP